MSNANISAGLITELEKLCQACPKGEYTRRCPFPIFKGLTRVSRAILLQELEIAQALRLFDLASDCSCPSDPRCRAEMLTPVPMLPAENRVINRDSASPRRPT